MYASQTLLPICKATTHRNYVNLSHGLKNKSMVVPMGYRYINTGTTAYMVELFRRAHKVL